MPTSDVAQEVKVGNLSNVSRVVNTTGGKSYKNNIVKTTTDPWTPLETKYTNRFDDYGYYI